MARISCTSTAPAAGGVSPSSCRQRSLGVLPCSLARRCRRSYSASCRTSRWASTSAQRFRHSWRACTPR
eukprot:scaffold50190_cov75-Phaeocystis_antarctica.AAC.1